MRGSPPFGPPAMALRASGGVPCRGPAGPRGRVPVWPSSAARVGPRAAMRGGGPHTRQGMRKKCRTAGAAGRPGPLGRASRCPLGGFFARPVSPRVPPRWRCGAALCSAAGSLIGRPCSRRAAPVPACLPPSGAARAPSERREGGQLSPAFSPPGVVGASPARLFELPPSRCSCRSPAVSALPGFPFGAPRRAASLQIGASPLRPSRPRRPRWGLRGSARPPA